MKPYDLSHMTDAQLHELHGRLIEELGLRREERQNELPQRPKPGDGNMTSYNVMLCKRIAEQAERDIAELRYRPQVGHYPPADKAPPSSVVNPY